ncbi:SEFIR domain protein, partial [Thiorhodococcus drewsii AZ1]
MEESLRVFISYSHDSDTHRERVLALSERLRQDGIETILDRYVKGSPAEGWPRWMMNGLDAADRVLVICTPTYYRRFRGLEAPGQGKGVDWEGAIVTLELYHARSSTTRFVPLIFDTVHEGSIPEPLRGQSWYCLTSEAAYKELYDVLLDQAGVEPGALGPLKVKLRGQGKPLQFDDSEDAGGDDARDARRPDETKAPRAELSHLPAGTEHFLGRGPELAALDAAWAEGSATSVVELKAPGGTGKTALVKRWLDCRLRPAGWCGSDRVFGWSFYSQGTGEDRQASEDPFLAATIQWFGVQIEPSANPADKGRALAERICTTRTLLILDGLEPLQYPPGPLAGELRAPGLKTLLTQLAAAGHPGLCVLTSREWLQDLGEWVRTESNPHGAVLRLDLGNLDESDGAALLHARGATRAGAAPIGPDDAELRAASREVLGHALTLSLLGRYLKRTKGGDIRRRDTVGLVPADRDARRHAAKVVAAYETWFAREGETCARELAALRLLGFFDRPAS